MPQKILKQRVQTSFQKRLYSYNQHAEVQTRMAEELIDRLQQVPQRRFDAVLEIGCGSGVLTERFLKSFRSMSFHANDIVEGCEKIAYDIFRQYPEQGEFQFLAGDIEQLEALPVDLDLIVSNATFQWLEDFNGFLTRIKAHLKKDGVLAFSTFGPQNLREIRVITGNSLTYLSFREVEARLQQHFQRVSCSEELVSLEFSSPRKVLKHLRLTGVNGVSKQHWTKTDLHNFEWRYRECFEDLNGQVPLSYHPILCVAKNS
ncbi:MAG: malonyl-ACP O-methyltransferase BioC [bacterium]|nr:malonyl-ACP O-methyltransferase BioC [bacterium]